MQFNFFNFYTNLLIVFIDINKSLFIIYYYCLYLYSLLSLFMFICIYVICIYYIYYYFSLLTISRDNVKIRKSTEKEQTRGVCFSNLPGIFARDKKINIFSYIMYRRGNAWIITSVPSNVDYCVAC